MSTEIKNTLFRFVTMRAPETLSKANKTIGFVFHPDLDEDGNKLVGSSASHFKENINTPKSSTALQFQDLQSKILTFPTDKLLVSMVNLKSLITEGFLDFANDFSKIKKEALRKKSMIELVPTVPAPLDSATLVTLWDNLFYQIITQKNAPLRDTIMHVLIANHNLTKTDLKSSGQMVKTSVVIPPRFYGNTTSESGIRKRSAEIANKPDQEALNRMYKNFKINDAKKLIDLTLQAKVEIERLEKVYNKEDATTRSKRYKEYQKTVKELIKKATVVENKFENKVTGEIKITKEYVDLEIPDFDYEPKSQINKDNYNESIGDKIFIIADLEDIQDCDTYVDIYRLLQKIISDSNSLISDNETPNDKVAIIAGVPIYPNNQIEARNGNSFTIKLKITGSSILARNNLNNQPEMSLSKMLKTIDGQNLNANKPPLYNKIYWNNVEFQINNLVISDIISSSCHFENSNDQTVNELGEIIFDGFSPIGTEIISSCEIYDIEYNNSSVYFICNLELADGLIKTKTLINLGISGALIRTAQSTATFIPNIVVNPPNGDTGTGTTGDTGSGNTGNTGNTGDTGNTGTTGTTSTNPPALTFVPSKFGIKNLGVADYRKVEQEVCCYEPGEVSHIENIMAREYKEKSTERVRSSEVTQTSSSEQEKENLTDTTSTSRNEMHSEVAQILREDMQIGLSSTVNQEWIGGDISITGNFNHNTSQEDSNVQATTFAQDVTQRAMERVVAKIKTEKISKVVETYKENNKHGFDNTKGEQHVSGVYRWINKVYNNQIVNYGKRAMVEFMIPEPSHFHVLASIKNVGEDAAFTMVEPVDPRSTTAGNNQIANYKEIAKSTNTENYIYWASKYGVEVDIRPSEFLSLGKGFSKSQADGDQWSNKGSSVEIDIPSGYYLDHATAIGHMVPGSGSGEVIITASVANRFLWLDGRVHYFDEKFYNKVPISVEFNKIWLATINVNLTFKRSEELYQSWQNRIYNDIIDAYEAKLEIYNTAKKEAKNKAAETFGVNSQFYRQIERNALKKNIMHYLVDEKYIGQDYVTNDKDMQTTRPIHDQAFDTNAAVALFMEQAFEWNIISYTFYPYYWGASVRWKSAYNYQFDDALFTNFMQAGMARVVLTVRPGFEKAVNWYMATGQVWNGGQVPTLGEDLFLSLDQELKETEPKAEGLPWKTKLPSDLTVIQSSNIGLEASGLPCGCPTTEGGEVNLSGEIKGNNNLIGGPATIKSENPVLVGGTK